MVAARRPLQLLFETFRTAALGTMRPTPSGPNVSLHASGEIAKAVHRQDCGRIAPNAAGVFPAPQSLCACPPSDHHLLKIDQWPSCEIRILEGLHHGVEHSFEIYLPGKHPKAAPPSAYVETIDQSRHIEDPGTIGLYDGRVKAMWSFGTRIGGRLNDWLQTRFVCVQCGFSGGLGSPGLSSSV